MSSDKHYSILVYKDKKGKEVRIEPNQTWQVVPKYDADAPDGFQKFRTTKVLDVDAARNNENLAVFDMDKGIYDTGLSKLSKGLNRLYNGTNNLPSALKEITTHITNPLIEIKGKVVLDETNFQFWDEFSEEVYVDKVFSTNDPIQRYAIYSLLLQGKVAPVDFASDPHYKNTSQYSVQESTLVVDAKTKRELSKNEAIFKFMSLLQKDKSSLVAILDFLNIKGLEGADNSLLNSVFSQWLDRDENQNPEMFHQKYADFYESESGKQVLLAYKNLKTLDTYKRLKRELSGIYLNSEFIGKTLIEAAENAVKNKNIMASIVDQIDSLTQLAE